MTGKTNKGEVGMKQDRFLFAFGIFGVLCVPFAYMAYQTNLLVHADPDKGDH
jgi:hypothetical protein